MARRYIQPRLHAARCRTTCAPARPGPASRLPQRQGRRLWQPKRERPRRHRPDRFVTVSDTNFMGNPGRCRLQGARPDAASRPKSGTGKFCVGIERRDAAWSTAKPQHARPRPGSRAHPVRPNRGNRRSLALRVAGTRCRRPPAGPCICRDPSRPGGRRGVPCRRNSTEDRHDLQIHNSLCRRRRGITRLL